MKPVIHAIEICDAAGEDFQERLAWNLSHGYVWSGPRAFVMAHIVTENGRTGWYVELAAGEMGEFFEVDPVKPEWVAFRRTRKRGACARSSEKVAWHRYDRIKALALKLKT